MAGGAFRAAPVAEALGRCCVVRGGCVGWAPVRWADGAVPARHRRRGVLRSHLRRVALALEELPGALRHSNLTESLEPSGRPGGLDEHGLGRREGHDKRANLM